MPDCLNLENFYLLYNIMGNYNKAYIYGIKCNKTKGLYIGSSIEPIQTRLGKHITDLRGYLGINPRPRCYRSSFEVLMNNDYEMFKICDVPCESREELEIVESLYINNNVCVNKRLPRKLKNQELIEKMINNHFKI